MTYVHTQPKDQPIIVRGVELPSDTGFWTLRLWGSAALGLSINTGIATYLADVATFSMAREAMRRVVDRAPEQRIVLTRWLVGSVAMDAQYRVQVPLCAVER